MNALEMLEALINCNTEITSLLNQISASAEQVEDAAPNVKKMVYEEDIAELKKKYIQVLNNKREYIANINAIKDAACVECLMFLYANGKQSIANYVIKYHISYAWGVKRKHKAIHKLQEVLDSKY